MHDTKASFNRAGWCEWLGLAPTLTVNLPVPIAVYPLMFSNDHSPASSEIHPPRGMGWHFDNTYAKLPEVFFEQIHPVTVKRPELKILNLDLASRLGLKLEEADPSNLASIFAGNEIPDGANPIAQAYAGHQFGGFTMLGDGRAILLGEQVTPSGDRVDIQLKGSGQTPFSRRGDGRAALGPMLRE